MRAAAVLLGRDLDADGVDVVPIGGAMAIRHALAEHGPDGRRLRLAGLVDVGEVRHVMRALFDGSSSEPSPGALARAGFFVCHRDLEDELVRALGPRRVEAELAARGDLARFRTFQHQPAHRTEHVVDQLRRFLGTTAGRKISYGRHLVEALAPHELPEPLVGVLAAAAPDGDRPAAPVSPSLEEPA